jgi:hypothetical protein
VRSDPDGGIVRLEDGGDWDYADANGRLLHGVGETANLTDPCHDASQALWYLIINSFVRVTSILQVGIIEMESEPFCYARGSDAHLKHIKVS